MVKQPSHLKPTKYMDVTEIASHVLHMAISVICWLQQPTHRLNKLHIVVQGEIYADVMFYQWNVLIYAVQKAML